MKLFRRKKKDPILPTQPTNYPYGLCVKTESGYFFMKEKMRFRIPTTRVLKSWNFSVIESSDEAIRHIRVAGKIGFRDGTLIKNFSDGKVYLVSHNRRLHISDPDTFVKYGLNRDNIIEVSDEETKLHNDGEVLV